MKNHSALPLPSPTSGRLAGWLAGTLSMVQKRDRRQWSKAKSARRKINVFYCERLTISPFERSVACLICEWQRRILCAYAALSATIKRTYFFYNSNPSHRGCVMLLFISKPAEWLFFFFFSNLCQEWVSVGLEPHKTQRQQFHYPHSDARVCVCVCLCVHHKHPSPLIVLSVSVPVTAQPWSTCTTSNIPHAHIRCLWADFHTRSWRGRWSFPEGWQASDHCSGPRLDIHNGEPLLIFEEASGDFPDAFGMMKVGVLIIRLATNGCC